MSALKTKILPQTLPSVLQELTRSENANKTRPFKTRQLDPSEFAGQNLSALCGKWNANHGSEENPKKQPSAAMNWQSIGLKTL
jgi:hypothetical protein